MTLESNAHSIPSTDTWIVLNNSDSSSVEGLDINFKWTTTSHKKLRFGTSHSFFYVFIFLL